MSSEGHISIIDKMKKLVAENKTEEVIDSLFELADKIPDKKLSNNVTILSSRYGTYVEEKTLGTVNSEEGDIKLAKLNQAILNIIDSLPNEIFHPPVPPPIPIPQDNLDKAIDKAIKIMTIVLFGVGVLGVIGSIIFILAGGNKNAEPGDYSIFIPFIASFMSIITGGVFYKVYRKK